MGVLPPRLAMDDEFVLDQQPVNGVDGGDLWELVSEHTLDFGRSPQATAANLQDPRSDGFWSEVGAGVGAMGAVLEAGQAFRLVAFQPLMTGRAADSMASAQLREWEEGSFGLQNEAGAFGSL